MSKKVALSNLNATTLDILNVIRANASYEYQQTIPVVHGEKDIRTVGELLTGAPALQNQFINALVNRIAFVKMQSATFNNPYAILKKGYIDYGETIEDIFVGLVDCVEYDASKGEQREFKITKPEVHSVFHIMNWRVMYPVTVQKNDLKRAFLSLDGVTDLISKIVEQVYTSAEYDEFLLFKYMLIKSVTAGKLYPKSIGTGTDMKVPAVEFRSMSNTLPFISTKYNNAGVRTNTPKDRQVIFMDANYNAQFDVNVLASAFNMDKADFMGRLFLIDDFTTFDNDRFDVIRANSDMLEEVTAAELALMADVKAIMLDEEWFQVYDNENEFTEKYVASGLYWNYFYHTWKTFSYSPFANAVVFVSQATNTAITPESFSVTVDTVSRGTDSAVITLRLNDTPSLNHLTPVYEQDADNTALGVAINPSGSVLIPFSALTAEELAANECILNVYAKIGNTEYECASTNYLQTPAGTVLTFTAI